MSTESSPTPSEARDIVVIGASSGGVGVIADLLGRLPSTIPAAIFVVLHLGKGYRGDMAGMLARDCALPVSFATDGELIVKGHVYIAPGDENMLLESGRIVVQASLRESYHRPSINALFRSARRRMVGVCWEWSSRGFWRMGPPVRGRSGVAAASSSFKIQPRPPMPTCQSTLSIPSPLTTARDCPG